MTEIQNRSAAVSEFVLMLVRGGLVRSVLPVTLSLAVVLLTSVAVAAIRPHLSVRDPEDLALPDNLYRNVFRQHCCGHKFLCKRARRGLLRLSAVRQHFDLRSSTRG
jgi:hypothetical protein